MLTVGTIILAILAFGLLIVVHEFGHFITAKRGGVQVNEFCIGMGPALITKEFRGTLYALRALPFGGACIMEGEDADSSSKNSFGSASRPRRALILSAGALMNFLTGFLLTFALLLSGGENIAVPVIDSFQEGFAYRGESMLLEGDKILSVNGYRVLRTRDFSIGLAKGGYDAVFDIKLVRDGETMLLRDVPLTREFANEKGQPVYGIQFETKEGSFLGYMREGALISVNYARLVWNGLGDLFSGQVGVGQLSGPVGVAGVMAETARSSFADFVSLVAFISVNLGVMNLLPLPALDGGRLLFLLIEAIRRKPISPKYEGFVHGAGLALLLLLMIYVTGNDILRLITVGIG